MQGAVWGGVGCWGWMDRRRLGGGGWVEDIKQLPPGRNGSSDRSVTRHRQDKAGREVRGEKGTGRDGSPPGYPISSRLAIFPPLKSGKVNTARPYPTP